MLRRTYDWMMRLAGHQKAPQALFWVSFIESSVFPDPAGRDAGADGAGAAAQGLDLRHHLHRLAPSSAASPAMPLATSCSS